MPTTLPVSVTRSLTRSVQPGPVYRVVDSCTTSDGIDPAVFVFRLSDDGFSHVATVRDLVTYPATRAAAVTAKADFYRLATVTFESPSVREANSFTVTVTHRVQALCNEYRFARDNFLGNGTPQIIVTVSATET